MNRINQLFATKSRDILNVYFTAGHPGIDDTVHIIQLLEQNGIDLVEVGMPYSDPLADGPTIQSSSQIALKNGMTLTRLFDQIKIVRQTSNIPIILMGYFNQMMQFGEEKFINKCVESGVDGLIIPDLPMDVFESEFKGRFEEKDLAISFLITPETSDERIKQADRLSSAFLYVVSKSSITGSSNDISNEQEEYFNHLDRLTLRSPRLIGFGIHDRTTFGTACRHANGAIIGSAFIRALEQKGSLKEKIESFVQGLR